MVIGPLKGIVHLITCLDLYTLPLKGMQQELQNVLKRLKSVRATLMMEGDAQRFSPSSATVHPKVCHPLSEERSAHTPAAAQIP